MHIVQLLAARDQSYAPTLVERSLNLLLRRGRYLNALPGPTMVMEYLENGNLRQFMSRAIASNERIPNRVLWVIFLCRKISLMLSYALVGLTVHLQWYGLASVLLIPQKGAINSQCSSKQYLATASHHPERHTETFGRQIVSLRKQTVRSPYLDTDCLSCDWWN